MDKTITKRAVSLLLLFFYPLNFLFYILFSVIQRMPRGGTLWLLLKTEKYPIELKSFPAIPPPPPPLPSFSFSFQQKLEKC